MYTNEASASHSEQTLPTTSVVAGQGPSCEVGQPVLSSSFPARRRGPRPSPAKMKRDALRVDAHQVHSGSLNASADIGSTVTPVEHNAMSGLLVERLEPIVEAKAHSCKVMDKRKREQKELLRAKHVQEREVSTVSMRTATVHAPGDAVKAEEFDLDIGTKRLLENAKFVISEQTQIYGLVGPNGCGKTTLMRVIAGEFAPESQIPMPRAWGLPYLVDQLDPEPTGRSPVEEVLSSCTERTICLEKHRVLTEQLASLDENTSVDEDDLSLLEKITEDLADLDEQLARWDSSEKEVTRILSALGFHDGETSTNEAPSLRVKDELVHGSKGLQLDGPVEVRDSADEEWLRGTVTSIEPLMVKPDGFLEAFTWMEVRHARDLSGGWRKKVQLAKALWLKPKLLLLDEPTNHLDLHALTWLVEELRAYPHTVVIVSHNPCFLAEVCNRVLQIVDKRIQTIPMADLSLESLAAMQRSDEKHRKFRDWNFAFPLGDEAEMHALSFHNVSFSYSPEAQPVLRDVHRDVVRFSGRSRAVVLGRNGSGKSTLLKLCLGVAKPTQGEVDVSCEMRHFSQHFNEALGHYPQHVAASYLVECCRPALQKRFKHTDHKRLLEGACEVLSWFGLEKRQAMDTLIKDLSGGQKARLNFAFLSLCPAHLLILDEPTNHLDANGLEHLADALSRFEGGVVLVSHDELLIRRVLHSTEHSELLICSGGTIRKQCGLQGFDAYRRAAFREQFERAETAARAAEQRLQASRQERRDRPRGRRRASISAASTREPTPEAHADAPRDSVHEPLAIEPSKLDAFFKNKAKKKPKPVNFNVRAK